MAKKKFEKPTMEQIGWVFERLRDHLAEGGSYRQLVYQRLGLRSDKGSYGMMQMAGALAISNALGTAKPMIQAEIVSRHPLIEQRHGVCGGDPVIRGTRISTEHIFALFHDLKKKIAWIQSQYPHVDEKGIQAAIDFQVEWLMETGLDLVNPPVLQSKPQEKKSKS